MAVGAEEGTAADPDADRLPGLTAAANETEATNAALANHASSRNAQGSAT
jgi:hypothetical protein